MKSLMMIVSILSIFSFAANASSVNCTINGETSITSEVQKTFFVEKDLNGNSIAVIFSDDNKIAIQITASNISAATARGKVTNEALLLDFNSSSVMCSKK